MAKKRTRKQKKRAQQKRWAQTPAIKPPLNTANKPQVIKDTTRAPDKGPIIKDLFKTVWVAGIILVILLAVYFFFSNQQLAGG